MKRYLRHHVLFARSPNSIPLLRTAFENPPFVVVARTFWVVILGVMYLGHGNLTVNFYPTNVNNKKLRARTSESRKRHYERRIGAAKVYLWKVVAKRRFPQTWNPCLQVGDQPRLSSALQSPSCNEYPYGTFKQTLRREVHHVRPIETLLILAFTYSLNKCIFTSR
ncbi:hypothetical protein TNCT_657481 [Trichonephila clavata]|uniref:Uncharacterized protein n=1 Tax=Trichonephila clavata TaxID=2740835 RepID=A0A8X6F5X0_TRICU|nr:hypothetical protein TNCT_657481 [Trichonephila clavata]